MAHHSFRISTNTQTEFLDITSRIKRIVADTEGNTQLCTVYIPHTTCGVTINEAADPAVKSDMLRELNKIVPFDDNYAHAEGNSAAHIKTSMMGLSVSIPVTEGRLLLGTWQGIYLCEFDGPRTRTVHVTIT